MRKRSGRSKFFTPGRSLTLLFIVLLITGVFTKHVFAIQPAEDPERGIYEGAQAEMETGVEEDAELPAGVLPSNSGIMTEDDQQEDRECLITLDAGANGFFTGESGESINRIVVKGIKGQYFSQILPELPVPESLVNERFTGWCFSGDEAAPGEWPGTMSGPLYGLLSESGETVLEQDCTLCAVWEDPFAGNGDQQGTEYDPGEDAGQEFDDTAGDTDEAQLQPESGIEGGIQGGTEGSTEGGIQGGTEGSIEGGIQGGTDEAQPLPEDGTEDPQFLPEGGTDGDPHVTGDGTEDGQSVTEDGEEEDPFHREDGPEDEQFPEDEHSGEEGPELQENEPGLSESDPENQETESDGTGQDRDPQEPETGGAEQDPELQETDPDGTGLTQEQEMTEEDILSGDLTGGDEAQTEENAAELPDGEGQERTQAEEAPAEAFSGEEQEQAQTGGTPAGDGSAAGGTQDRKDVIQEKGQETDKNEAVLPVEDVDEEAVSENAANAVASDLTQTEKAKTGQGKTGNTPTFAPVVRKKIGKAKITLSRSRYVYTGKAIKPGVTVVYGKTTLKKNRDYKIVYSANVSAGKATVKITGTGKFEGTAKKTFTITRAAQKLTLKAGAGRVSVGKTITVKAGGAKETRKYSFKSSNRAVAKVSSKGKITGVKVGTVKITASTSATRNYRAGSKTITVKVVPAAAKRLKAANRAGGIRLSWTRVAGANGYYLYRDGIRIATINKGSTVSYLDKKANKNGRQYTYKLVARASTGTSTLSRSVRIRRWIGVSLTNTSTARYCLEQRYVKRTLERSGRNHLAVIDPTGVSKSVISRAKDRGAIVYGYVNAGALENTRKYYNEFKDLRIAEYDGWDGEYWVDVTKTAWKNHLIDEAKKQKAAGVTGVYFDNVEIYYMVRNGFHGKHLYRDPPSQDSVYKALSEVIGKIENEVGIVVMPNCGDTFVRRFEKENPGVIVEVNVEGVLYEDFERNSHEEEKYLTDYLDWCSGRGMITRGIEYTTSSSGAEKAREYYRKHGWNSVYISRHKNLEGD